MKKINLNPNIKLVLVFLIFLKNKINFFPCKIENQINIWIFFTPQKPLFSLNSN